MIAFQRASGRWAEDRRLRVRLLGRDEVHRVVGVEVDQHAARLYAATAALATWRSPTRA